MRAWGVGAVAVLALAGCGGGKHAAAPTTTTGRTIVVRKRTHAPWPPKLSPVAAGSLPAPIQDAAAAAYGRGAVLLGGHPAADTSTDQIAPLGGTQ